jgi:hypothetical protein
MPLPASVNGAFFTIQVLGLSTVQLAPIIEFLKAVKPKFLNRFIVNLHPIHMPTIPDIQQLFTALHLCCSHSQLDVISIQFQYHHFIHELAREALSPSFLEPLFAFKNLSRLNIQQAFKAWQRLGLTYSRCMCIRLCRETIVRVLA